MGRPLSVEDHAELSRLFRQHFKVLLDGATELSEHDGADLVAEAFEALATGARACERDKDIWKSNGTYCPERTARTTMTAARAA